MRTSELRKEVENMGYYLVERASVVEITDTNTSTLICINSEGVALLDSDWEHFKNLPDSERCALLDLACEYVKTPISERKEEQLYYVQLVDDVDGFLNRDTGHGNLLISNSPENCDFQTRFTEAEINAMNPKYMQFAIPVEGYKYS